jgi:hypothetical protein
MKNLRNIGLLLIILGSLSCRRSANLIGLNQNIRHDDFNYRVTLVERRKTIHSGTDEMVANGEFLIVTFTVENDAARVGHIWDNNIAYILTDAGGKFENNADAQQLLNAAEPFHWQDQYNTPHGETESTRLVFDIPGHTNKAYLKVRGEMLMGDVFNLNRFKRIKIKLF